MSKRVHFVVTSVLGKKIEVSNTYWQYIVSFKHPSIRRREKEVKQTLIAPNIVKKSQTDQKVLLYYGKYNNRTMCVAAKHLNGSGFVITAYWANKIKKGEIIWPEK